MSNEKNHSIQKYYCRLKIKIEIQGPGDIGISWSEEYQ